MKVQQKYLGKTGTLIFLTVISAFPPLTTDLYLPALPQLVEHFSTTTVKVNMTLSLFFIFYAAALLFWGPLSEKYGRKPVLFIGHCIYILASILCVLSQTVDHLIIARVLQAFGGGAVSVVAMAVVKDLYDGRQREKIMATVMTLMSVAPMVAPVLGAFLLKIATWQMVFVFLAGFGCISMLMGILFQESLTQKYQGSLLRSWGRLFIVLRNFRFTSLLIIFSITAIPFMSFLGAASFIYISHFGFSEQAFSFFFAFNVLFATSGPVLYMYFSKRFPTQRVITGCFVLIMLSGILIATFGHLSPWFFAAMIALATLANVMMRVPSANLMLEQQDKDTGSAAALMQFSGMLLGSAGMFMIAIKPESMIENLGGYHFVIGLIAGFCWLLVSNRPFVKDKLVVATKA